MYLRVMRRSLTVRAFADEIDPAKQHQQQKPASIKPRAKAAARPKQAYSVAPTSKLPPLRRDQRVQPEEVVVQPVQQLDDPRQWPVLSETLINQPSRSDAKESTENSAYESESILEPVSYPSQPSPSNFLRLPAVKATSPATSRIHSSPSRSSSDDASKTQQRRSRASVGLQRSAAQHAAKAAAGAQPPHTVRRHPPIAPEDPRELLQVRAMRYAL